MEGGGVRGGRGCKGRVRSEGMGEGGVRGG